MLDPVLVPLDSSLLAECILPHAFAIARAFDAKIMLLRVLDESQVFEKGQLFDAVNWQQNKTEAELYLKKTSARLQKAGLWVGTSVLEGLAAESITRFAQRQGMKLIILSSRGCSGLSQWGISSVTQNIIFSAPTSMFIIRADQPAASELIEGQYKRIMVPLDGSQGAENVLPMVARLARFHKSCIHVVHVVKTPEMARLTPPARENIELSEQVVSRNREEAIRYLDQVRLHSSLADMDVQTRLLTSDDATAALHELVEKEHIDMVVFSAHGYSGNNQWPYGSMVTNFIWYSKAPLLIVQDLPAREEPAMDISPRGRLERQTDGMVIEPPE